MSTFSSTAPPMQSAELDSWTEALRAFAQAPSIDHSKKILEVLDSLAMHTANMSPEELRCFLQTSLVGPPIQHIRFTKQSGVAERVRDRCKSIWKQWQRTLDKTYAETVETSQSQADFGKRINGVKQMTQGLLSRCNNIRNMLKELHRESADVEDIKHDAEQPTHDDVSALETFIWEPSIEHAKKAKEVIKRLTTTTADMTADDLTCFLETYPFKPLMLKIRSMNLQSLFSTLPSFGLEEAEEVKASCVSIWIQWQQIKKTYAPEYVPTVNTSHYEAGRKVKELTKTVEDMYDKFQLMVKESNGESNNVEDIKDIKKRMMPTQFVPMLKNLLSKLRDLERQMGGEHKPGNSGNPSKRRRLN